MNTPNLSKTSIIVQLSDVAVGYQTKKSTHIIADHLNLNLNQGEIICLLGPNGCGKSTLLRTIAGMQQAIVGDISILGENVKTMDITELAKNMSIVLTDVVDVPNMTVYDIVAYGRFPYTNWLGIKSEKDEKLIYKSLAAVSLTDFSSLLYTSLSDGEKQRVMIARALAQETPLILLDEPTAHLDLPNRIEVMNLLRELAHDTGRTILLSTHELELAVRVADIIWLMPCRAPIISGKPDILIKEGAFEKTFNTVQVSKYLRTFVS